MNPSIQFIFSDILCIAILSWKVDGVFKRFSSSVSLSFFWTSASSLVVTIIGMSITSTLRRVSAATLSWPVMCSICVVNWPLKSSCRNWLPFQIFGKICMLTIYVRTYLCPYVFMSVRPHVTVRPSIIWWKNFYSFIYCQEFVDIGIVFDLSSWQFLWEES